jgi:hypothetical protein
MKKILLIAFALGSFLWSLAAPGSQYGWLYLNNGNILKGQITKAETSVTIVTDNGDEFTYPMIEVNKITDKAPVQPRVTTDPGLTDLATNDTGFWMRAGVIGGSTIFIEDTGTPTFEVNVAGGYRFSQYLKVGIGFGYRYYFNNEKIRSKSSASAFPIFATISGNFISDAYRTVVPYYSFDFGATACDGVMMRPTIGMRIGQSRSALLLGLTYTGQQLRYVNCKYRFVSSLGLTVGYEF